MRLSIVIPVYNEEFLVIQVIEKLYSITLPSCVQSMELLVVDDCSKDSTHERLRQFRDQSGHPFILLKHDLNKGKGAAVRTGIAASKGDVLLIQDADLELSPDDIPAMINAMDELKIEFINGSRYLPGVNRPLSSYSRYLGNKVFTWFTSIVINVRLTDMACGYKLFSKSLYDKIQLKENRFGFEAELIIKAMRIKKNNIAEVPVRYFPRNEGEGKKLRNSDAFKILKTILKYGLFRIK